MEDFSDNKTRENLISQLYNAKTIGDMFSLIESEYKGWIVKIIDKYCDKFDILNENWNTVCEMCNTTKKKIIVVENLDMVATNNKCIKNIAEMLTRMGYNIRTVKDINKCKSCGYAILAPELEELFLLKFPDSEKKCTTRSD